VVAAARGDTVAIVGGELPADDVDAARVALQALRRPA
jgi:hypothetical protein